MKQGKENFEVVKDKEEGKRNYLFKKDKLTQSIFYFVAIVLAILVVGVIITSIDLG